MTTDSPRGFAARLAETTKLLHSEAEKSGLIAELMHGRGTVESYALLMRNLLPAYQSLEAGLERHRRSPLVGRFARPEAYRSAAIIADLVHLIGADWADILPELPEARFYAETVDFAVLGNGELLIAHAYTRTLGDLSGGQIMRRLLERSLGEQVAGLQFHEFPQIADLAAVKTRFRTALDDAGPELTDPQAVLREAQRAFRHNIAVSNAVMREAAIRISTTF